NGFSDVGRRRNYYSNPIEDAILMSLSSFSG
ncbi:MAG: ribosomal-protein-alanine N-acetyltransferase, partial [Pyrinomonadaceae bacterium]|nr:ribosomal-protein-alanine N-acetyltransferase [Pyrinomonadaceae bacterium]